MYIRICLALIVMAACAGKATKLFVAGDEHALRERDQGARGSSPEAPPILLVAIDGVSRSMLYDMLRGGELPTWPSCSAEMLSRTPISTIACCRRCLRRR